MTGGEIGQRRGDGEGRHLPGAPQEDRLLLFFDGGKSPDGRTDAHPCPLRLGRADGKARIGQGHLRGGQGVNDEIVQASQFFFIDILERIETLQLPGDPGLISGAVKSREPADAGFPLADPLPGFRDGVAERCDGAHA